MLNYIVSLLQHRNVELKYVLRLRTKSFKYTLLCYLLENIFHRFL